MKQISNKRSIQNITVSNFLNRLESFNFCTYKVTKENHETLRERHLPQKLKFWNQRIFGNNTFSNFSTLLIENYSQNQCQYENMILIKADGIVKTRNTFFQLHWKTPFLTLILIKLNFVCYRKDWNVNVTKLFWEQQKRLSTSSSSWDRYHPIIICFFLGGRWNFQKMDQGVTNLRGHFLILSYHCNYHCFCVPV